MASKKSLPAPRNGSLVAKPYVPPKGGFDVMAGPAPMATTPAMKGPAFCVNQTGLRLGLNK